MRPKRGLAMGRPDHIWPLASQPLYVGHDILRGVWVDPRTAAPAGQDMRSGANDDCVGLGQFAQACVAFLQRVLVREFYLLAADHSRAVTLIGPTAIDADAIQLRKLLMQRLVQRICDKSAIILRLWASKPRIRRIT